MLLIGTIIVNVLILLGLELLFRLKRRGRIVLTMVYLIWAVADAFLTARQNPGHELGALAISFCDSIVPLALWQWISSAIRNSKERRLRETLQSGTLELAAISIDKEGTMGEKFKSGIGCVLYGAFWLLCVGGWFQHLYTCFNEHYWGFLIAGAIFFPVAIIHGWGIWLGFWH